MFDKLKEKSQLDSDGIMIKHNNDPSAWAPDNNYTSFKNAYNNVYVEQDEDDFCDNIDDLYGSFKPKDSYDKLSKDDIEDIKPVSYTDSHNNINENYNKSLDDMLRERESQTNNLHTMDYNKYRDDTGDYGIFDKLGVNPKNISCLEDDEYLKQRYDKLIKDRTH